MPSAPEWITKLLNDSIREDDPRMLELKSLEKSSNELDLSNLSNTTRQWLEDYKSGNWVIPDFQNFLKHIDAIYEQTKLIQTGEVATYIPQLARTDPDLFAVSVCTLDGQVASFGDYDQWFCAQSISKVISYWLALEEYGDRIVHSYIGQEPSGRSFNELSLNHKGQPHNPMLNSGGIVTSSMIRCDDSPSERFDYVMERWGEICHIPTQFNNSVYTSEKTTADRNFALGYLMKENHVFPHEEPDLHMILDFYFQCCSIEVQTQHLAIAAATFAGGGIHPLGYGRTIQPHINRHILSTMLSCGMYDYSGEFAFLMGMPAKSGVSGAIMIVLPGVGGLSIWSPRLDRCGNSVRGIEFCRLLTERFAFHMFDGLGRKGCGKLDVEGGLGFSKESSVKDADKGLPS